MIWRYHYFWKQAYGGWWLMLDEVCGWLSDTLTFWFVFPTKGTGWKSRIMLFFPIWKRQKHCHFQGQGRIVFSQLWEFRYAIISCIICRILFCHISYVQHHIMPFHFEFPCLSTLATYISAKASVAWTQCSFTFGWGTVPWRMWCSSWT